GIGVGAKDWKIIPKIYEQVKLDWVMFANSMTLISHPPDLFDFMKKLAEDRVGIFNSAIFQSGFLVGGNYYDYKLIRPDSRDGIKKFKWRESFFETCREFEILPAHACIQFALNLPGVSSVALSTTDPSKVKTNVEFTHTKIRDEFWRALKHKNLIAKTSP